MSVVDHMIHIGRTHPVTVMQLDHFRTIASSIASKASKLAPARQRKFDVSPSTSKFQAKGKIKSSSVTRPVMNTSLFPCALIRRQHGDEDRSTPSAMSAEPESARVVRIIVEECVASSRSISVGPIFLLYCLFSSQY